MIRNDCKARIRHAGAGQHPGLDPPRPPRLPSRPHLRPPPLPQARPAIIIILIIINNNNNNINNNNNNIPGLPHYNLCCGYFLLFSMGFFDGKSASRAIPGLSLLL